MIGLIFGDTDLPGEILSKIKKKKIKHLIIDLSRARKYKKEKKNYDISVGQFGKIIKHLKKITVKKYCLQVKLLNQNFQNLN